MTYLIKYTWKRLIKWCATVDTWDDTAREALADKISTLPLWTDDLSKDLQRIVDELKAVYGDRGDVAQDALDAVCDVADSICFDLGNNVRFKSLKLGR